MASFVRLVPSVLGEIRRVIEEDKKRKGQLESRLKNLKREMEQVQSLLKMGDTEFQFHGAFQETRILHLQELAYEVEDFIEGLWEPGKYGIALVSMGNDHRPQLLDSIDGFKDRLSSLQKEWKLSDELGKKRDDDPDEDAAAPSYDPARCKDLEVIEAPKEKLLELLSTSPAELKVISIVGCRGVGKTALARAIYEDPVVCREFGYVAWFEASGCKKADDLLSKAPEEGRTEAGRPPEEGRIEAGGAPEEGMTEAGGADTITSLRDLPADKRCLVFINDVEQAHMWRDTTHALLKKCEQSGISSRIIMTTRVHSVSTVCSSGRYVYRMQCLGPDESQDLFWRKVYDGQINPTRGPALDMASKSIFSKCDGLPLALSSVAKYLGANADSLHLCDFENMGRDLGKIYLSGDHDVFREMRRSIVQCCHRMPDYDHRASLLYLSVFPWAHHIQNKSLVRRLMAEGFVATSEDGSKCINMFIDHCMVDAVQFSSDSRDAKRCKVYGILLEYIIQKSASKNFVTLIQDGKIHTVNSTEARVRRLSIQSSNQGTCVEIPGEISLPDVRSLTIFNSVSSFQSCEKLRLLDLEGCTWVADDSKCLDAIGGLFLLKYLSLRNTEIKNLPKDMEKLQRLETLDIRGTGVENLPLQVIMLPMLAYLFGKFELPDVTRVSKKDSDFLTKKSKLHTISGFVIAPGTTRVMERLILQASNLKKVKVWAKDTSAAGVPMSGPANYVLASSSASAPYCVPQERKRKICTTGYMSSILLSKRCFTSLESVSILPYEMKSGSNVSSELCKDFLGSLEGTCNIRSIKLQGKLGRLPDSERLHFLAKINKLQLFSSGLSSKNLSDLQMLPGLEYLMIVEDCDIFCNDIFKVEKDGFQFLKRLCIKAPNIPRLQFMEGAMGFVNSLHLLCPDSSETKLAAETIQGFSHLSRLNEVVLHDSACQDAIQAWEIVAKQHPKWPSVVKLAAE